MEEEILGAMPLKDLPTRVESLVHGTAYRLLLKDLREHDWE